MPTTNTINTPAYLLDQAKRRLTPTLNNMPGLGTVEKRLRQSLEANPDSRHLKEVDERLSP